MKITGILFITFLVLLHPIFGQIMVDGSLDAAYTSYCLQNTPTQFGDNSLGQMTFANGSELDGAYAFRDGTNLCFILTGNLETNFNKLEVFIDCQSGGQNKLRGDNPNVDFDGLNRMGDDGGGNGLIFDAGFEADYYFTVGNGDQSGYVLFANMAEVLTSGGGAGTFLGGGTVGATTLTAGNGVQLGVNNSNTAGVDGSSVNTPASVTTGIEWCIPLSVIGNPTGDIKISAFVNGSNHDFLSNQALCGLGGAGNLGEPRNVDFSGIGGDQFFTVPAPITPPTTVPTMGEWGLIILLLLMVSAGTTSVIMRRKVAA